MRWGSATCRISTARSNAASGRRRRKYGRWRSGALEEGAEVAGHLGAVGLPRHRADGGGDQRVGRLAAAHLGQGDGVVVLEFGVRLQAHGAAVTIDEAGVRGELGAQ